MELKWDIGTAYELFSSLYVIHDPNFFGVRPSWAAGIRSRIPAESREFFADILPMFKSPICWLYALPEPKSSAVVVERLEAMAADEVLPTLAFHENTAGEKGSVGMRVCERGCWDDDDIVAVVEEYKKHGETAKIDKKKLGNWFDWLVRPEEFGKLFVDGITEYYENFFREEERRISPALESGLDHAKKMAARLPLEKLLEELSQGIQSEMLMNYKEMLLVPSFWLSPFVMYGELDKDFGIMQFGARPADASLIPGDVVPDSLSTGLAALSDHTRLKILRLISEAPLTQVEIAKKLRLRAPTINHHLKTLRLASLVTKTFSDEDPKNTRYSIRSGRVGELCGSIKEFLGAGG